MPELEQQQDLYIYNATRRLGEYTTGQKVLDFIRLASAPSLISSTNAFLRIMRRVEHEMTVAQQLELLKMNSLDQHIFNASQENRGVVTQEVILKYANEKFFSEEFRDSFLQYVKFRLGHMAKLGLLNDISPSNEFTKENITVKGEDGPKEIEIHIKQNYRYEVNTNFNKYLKEYYKLAKEQFEFSGFDAFIYRSIEDNNGKLDFQKIQIEKIQKTAEELAGIMNQLRLMQSMGYIEEKEKEEYTLTESFKKRLEKKEDIYLNSAEKKILKLMEEHGSLKMDKYRIDIETGTVKYLDIVQSRVDRFLNFGFVQKTGSVYIFTPEGEKNLKDYYALTYMFKEYDRIILNKNINGIIDLEELKQELEGMYGQDDVEKTLESYKNRLFLMECAGLVQRTVDDTYTLTVKGFTILENENKAYLEERRETARAEFKYTNSEVRLYEFIKARAGTINPVEEIKDLLNSAQNDFSENKVYGQIMKNHDKLLTGENDGVKLGYIEQNEDGTLSLTVKGKNLVNSINSKSEEQRERAYRNCKVRLLNDIDKNHNKLNPDRYIKTRRIINDEDTRRQVNLLRFGIEKLHMVGLLDKNEDGTYSINQLYDEYQEGWIKELKENFEFSRFDAYIYNFIKGSNGIIDLDKIENEKVTQASHGAEMIKHQVYIMKEVGYLEEPEPGTVKFARGFKEKVEQGLYLNSAEKKIFDFIEKHDAFSYQTYVEEALKESKGYKGILQGRLRKLEYLDYIEKVNGQYKFTFGGEEQLKQFYSDTYEFTQFDRNILNNNNSSIIDLVEMRKELWDRYGDEAASYTLERYGERLFVMECAGLVERENADIYTLTENGTAVLEKENETYIDNRREILKQTFKFKDRDLEFLYLIKEKGGIINPKKEINEIFDGLDKENDISELKAYNSVFKNHESLLIRGGEETDKIRLGHIRQNSDGTFSLTAKGKRLIDTINSMEPEKKAKAYGNKKVKLLNDIDKDYNTLNPEIYLKSQKTIKDFGLSRTVSLLRYEPERLFLAELLDKDEDGTYIINDEYKLYEERYYQKDIELDRTHNFILKSCRNGSFSMEKHISFASSKKEGKALDADVIRIKFKCEQLIRAGYLEKIDEGTFELTGKGYEALKAAQGNVQEPHQEPDSFNFSNVHKYILKSCKNNEFSLVEYNEKISKKLSGKDLEREMQWKKSSCEKLTAAGYFEKIDRNTYRLTDTGTAALDEIKSKEPTGKKEFIPGGGYKFLLRKYSNDGIFDFKKAERRISEMPREMQEKELRIKNGMVRKLQTSGYIEAIDNSLFRLTEKGLELIKDEVKPPAAKEKADWEKEIKITKFDIDNIISQAKDGIFLKESLEQSPKKISVEKRIQTLVSAGFLIETDVGWQLTDKLLYRAKARENINLEHEKSHSKRHSIDCLTEEQKSTLTDLKDFLNLTDKQILKYIYGGNEVLFKCDMRYFLDKVILQKDIQSGVYILTKYGAKLASELTGDDRIFESKVISRREELKHDVLVYTAYKEVESELKEQGKRVTAIITDRKMRSDAMKNDDKTMGTLPDVRIEFEDKKTGKKDFRNLEMDINYSERVIAQKIIMKKLSYFTSTQRQASKVQRVAKRMGIKIDLRVVGHMQPKYEQLSMF